jgi:hypothetical protein
MRGLIIEIYHIMTNLAVRSGAITQEELSFYEANQ